MHLHLHFTTLVQLSTTVHANPLEVMGHRGSGLCSPWHAILRADFVTQARGFDPMAIRHNLGSGTWYTPRMSCIHRYYMVRLGMIRWSIWLDEKTVAALKKIGAEMERPVGWLVRKAVEEFIERGAQERRKGK